MGSYIRTIVTNEFPNLIKDFLFIRELNLGCVRVSLLLSLTRKILLLYTAWKPVKLEVPSLLFPNVFEFDITFTKKCEYKNYSIYTFRFPKEFSLFTNKEKWKLILQGYNCLLTHHNLCMREVNCVKFHHFHQFPDSAKSYRNFTKILRNKETSIVIRGILPHVMDAFNPIFMEPMAFLLHECYFWGAHQHLWKSLLKSQISRNRSMWLIQWFLIN